MTSRDAPTAISAPPIAPAPAAPDPAPAAKSASSLDWIAPLALTPLVLVVSGYHPFAGDAGIYVAGIRHILNPALYPLNAVFVTAFTHLSIFAWFIAALVRLTHLPLAWILLAAHLASIWLYLYACRCLAQSLFPGESLLPAILLAAVCASLPVAGTALVLMDPYVTARSFSTPLSLLALAAEIRLHPSPAEASARTALRIEVILPLAAACLLHPLMGLWTAAFLVLYLAIAVRRTRVALILCTLAVLIAGLIFAAARHTPIAPSYVQAVSLPERSFLFIARWHWYEIAGLVLPLLLFGIAARRLPPHAPARALALTCVVAGTTAIVIAALFVPPGGPYPLAPFQILRIFCPIYASGMVLISGLIVERRESERWARLSRGKVANRALPRLLLMALFAVMFLAQRVTWSGSPQIEWPRAAPRNPYQQAFLWIRTHTPPAAVFAFNPRLVYLPHEDEQGFRAITLRDHLADDKDAGISAVLPHLAVRWAAQRNPELFVDEMSDAERRRTLTPLGATWLLLPPAAATHLPCPYHNSVAHVCRLISETVTP